jgi:hypothetical protein
MSPNDPLPKRAQQRLASCSGQAKRLSDLHRVLALLTPAQGRELPGIVAECRAALDALCAYLMADRPALSELTGERHRLAINDLIVARRPLAEARAMLSAVIGDIGVPHALTLILEGNPQYGPYLPALAEQARADLDALRDAATGSAPVQPPLPTGDYCLLKGYRVRWQGETELQPLLWSILEYLLSQDDYPFTVGRLRGAIWPGKEVPLKTIQNRLSDLNKALLPVSFPWEYTARNNHVQRA